MAEKALYSSHVLEEQDLVKAEGYADEIGRLLNK